MKRTAKYLFRPLNKGKANDLRQLHNAFADAKDEFLRHLGKTAAWHYLDNTRKCRDAFKSHKGIPVHLRDQALFDAVGTLVRFIEYCLAATHIKARVFKQFDGAKRRYAFWLLRSYGRIGAVVQGKAPEPGFAVSPNERKEVVRFLRKKLRRSLGRAPKLRIRRSFALDNTLYRTFEHKGRQYISVAGLIPRKRLIIPLRGHGRISGNVRLIWDEFRKTVFIHMAYDVKMPAAPATGTDKGFGCRSDRGAGIFRRGEVWRWLRKTPGTAVRGNGDDGNGEEQAAPIGQESRTERGWCQSVGHPAQQPWRQEAPVAERSRERPPSPGGGPGGTHRPERPSRRRGGGRPAPPAGADQEPQAVQDRFQVGAFPPERAFRVSYPGGGFPP